MDYVRNIQNSDHVPKFLDGIHPVRTNPFGENKSGERAYRRAERLVAAIHLLTTHIPSDEPLRASVRATSIRLLSDALALRDEMRSLDSPRVHAFQARVRQLISMLRILAISSFVSVQNADAVIEALDDLGNFLTVSQRSPISENISLSREYLLDVRNMDDSIKKDIKDKHIKDGLVPYKKTSSTPTVRANTIIDILRTNGALGIREIAANMPEYSEKMIQRELTGLVRNGQLIRIGLKRWSKYSLPQVP
jgi:hypothetical protein